MRALPTPTAAPKSARGGAMSAAQRDSLVLTLSLLGAVLGGVAYYQYGYQPEAQRLELMRERLEQTRRSVREAQGILSGREALLNELRRGEQGLLQLVERHPQGYRNTPLVRDLREAAELTGVSLGTVALSLETRTDPELRRVNLDAAARGSLSDLYNFLRFLRFQPRFYASGPFALTLDPAPGRSKTLGVRFNLFAFYSTPKPPTTLSDPGPVPPDLLETP